MEVGLASLLGEDMPPSDTESVRHFIDYITQRHCRELPPLCTLHRSNQDTKYRQTFESEDVPHVAHRCIAGPVGPEAL